MIVAPASIFKPLELFAERLDDDFFGVDDFIHYQPELPIVRLQHDDIDCGVLIRLRASGLPGRA